MKPAKSPASPPKPPLVMLRDVPPGTLVVVRDKMPDASRPELEFRETWYRREPDDAPRAVAHPGFVPTTRLRTLQGEPSGALRYDSGPYTCTDPGISHGMTPVVATTILGGAAVDAFDELLRDSLPLSLGVVQ